MKLIDISGILRLLTGLLITSTLLNIPQCEAKQGITGFTAFNSPPRESNRINYQVDTGRAKFFTFIPDNYSGKENFGLIVYISPQNTVSDLPSGWAPILTKRKYLFVAAQGAGNDCPDFAYRMGLGVKGAMGMMRQYKVDPNRVYAAGLSGGARCANNLAFLQSDIFHGTIQDCGCDYWRPVKKVNATSETDSLGNTYGIADASQLDAIKAKSSVRFAIITGQDDYRRGNILDIYSDGFAKDGFQARLFDIPGMGHQDCSAQTLEKVLDYLEIGR